MYQWDAGTSFWSNSIFCERCRSDLIRFHAIAITCNRMRSHETACDSMQSHEIANLMSTTVRVLENASGTRSGTESLPKVFLHDNCEQISYIFFRLSQKGRNEKRDSFYTAKRDSSVHSCRDETRPAVISVPFPQNKFRMCFFQARLPMRERTKLIRSLPTNEIIEG